MTPSVKKLKAPALFAFIALIGVSLGACTSAAQNKAPDVFTLEQTPPPLGATMAGNYLAGRFAQRQDDWQAAQSYMSAVMAYDAQDPLLRQRAFLLAVGARQYDQAKKMALQMRTQKDAGRDLADIYLACAALKDGDYATALSLAQALPQDGFGAYTKPIMSAWAQAGLGRTQDALKTLRQAAKSDDDSVYSMHEGLIAEYAGDDAKAASRYKATMAGGLTLHSALTIASFFTRTGAADVSSKIFEGLSGLYPFNPFESATGAAAPAQKSVATPAAGAAFALYDLASMLYERRAYDSAQIYASMALLMAPSDPFTRMMMGDIEAAGGRYAYSVKDYDAVPATSRLYWLSRLRTAEVYEAGGAPDRAAALLKELAVEPAVRVQALVSLGDMYRRHDRNAEAVAAYDAVLKGVFPVTVKYWPVVYARGMAFERMNDWPQAEKDLLQALALQPNNPMILNFLGYSWADKGVHLTKALDYLRRAVAQRPDDGYILDSYGWAQYRAGKYADAVAWLEKAVTYIPDDSTILDHLGDAYWQAGRARDARYKWTRARELSKDASFRQTVERKLIDGIDAPPAQVAHKDGSSL